MQSESVSSQADAIPGLTDGNFQWIGGPFGDWTVASNWFDLDDGSVAMAPPGAQDNALIDGGDGTSITGTGEAATLTLIGTVQIVGNIAAAMLIDADQNPDHTLSLAPDATIAVLGPASGTQSNSATDTIPLVTTADPTPVLHDGFLTVAEDASMVMPAIRTIVPIWNDGIITLDAKSAIPTGQILGNGTVLIESGFEASLAYAGMMEAGLTIGPDQHIRFDGPNASIYLGNGTNTADTPILVENFAEGDALAVFGSVDAMQVIETARGDLLQLTELTGGVHGLWTTQYIQFDQHYAAEGLTFSLGFTGTGAFDRGYSTITVSDTVPCFCPGTLIATPNGDRPVESLSIGDQIVTAGGAVRPVLWIGRRDYHARFAAGREDLQPIRIRAGALGAGLPRRDLLVSPKHAMLVQAVLVPAELLVNGRTVIQEEVGDDIRYLHIELEDHALLLAEGATTESFVDNNSRSMFDNAAEFAALYQNHHPTSPARCSPRAEHGAALFAAQRFVSALAGLVAPTDPRSLRGRIDSVENNTVRGWAWCPDKPDAPVLLEILADGISAGHALADRFRADLLVAGYGAGCHGFEGLVPSGTRAVTVRRAHDGMPLAA